MSAFGLESHGISEKIEWSAKFAAWHLTLSKGNWVYERLIEENPRHMAEAVKDFYRDDALYSVKRETT
jgi:hypothetical protein